MKKTATRKINYAPTFRRRKQKVEYDSEAADDYYEETTPVKPEKVVWSE